MDRERCACVFVSCDVMSGPARRSIYISFRISLSVSLSLRVAAAAAAVAVHQVIDGVDGDLSRRRRRTRRD